MELVLADITALDDANAQVQQKQNKLQESIKKLAAEVDAKKLQVADANAERSKLQGVVDAQEMKPADVDRINGERKELGKQIVTFNVKLEKTNAATWEKEIKSQKKLDSVETIAKSYNDLCYAVELISSTANNAQCADYQLTFRGTEIEVGDMVNLDLKHRVK